MSNFLDDCRAYVVRVHDGKSGRHYVFSVVAETKPDAIDLVKEYAEQMISGMCQVKSATKLPNKAQVIDYRED